MSTRVPNTSSSMLSLVMLEHHSLIKCSVFYVGTCCLKIPPSQSWRESMFKSWNLKIYILGSTFWIWSFLWVIFHSARNDVHIPSTWVSLGFWRGWCWGSHPFPYCQLHHSPLETNTWVQHVLYLALWISWNGILKRTSVIS